MSFTSQNYPGKDCTNLSPADPFNESNEFLTRVPDVLLAFSRISTIPSFFRIYQNNCVPDIKYSGENDSNSSADTHFQGVIRHHNGSDFILSGGDKIDSAAQLFVLKTRSLLSRTTHSTDQLSTYEKGVLNRNPISANEIITHHQKKIQDIEDVCESITRINDYRGSNSNEGYWHAGGISRLRDIYVVPMESKTDSLIRFFYLQENGTFHHLADAEISDRINHKAGAAAIIRLRNKRYLLAVWQDGNTNGTQQLDFYITKGPSIKTGFIKKAEWFYRDCLSTDNINVTYQNIQFLEQENGALFLVGMENESTIGPGLPVPNIADLMSVTFNIDIHQTDDHSNIQPTIRKLTDKKMKHEKIMHNYDAGSSIYVDKNQELTLYSTYYYIKDKSFHIAEFPTQLEANHPAPSSVHFNKIELYTEEWFGGNIFRVQGDINSSISNLKNLKLNGYKKINKTFKSLKYQVAPDHTINLISSSGNTISLTHDGRVHHVATLLTIPGFEGGIAAIDYA